MIQELPLSEAAKSSPLYSPDLAPVPQDKRTWNKWNLAALWVGMAVCIPTYILSSYMLKSGLSWVAALVIIFLANLVITIPMVLNGHAGVKYGIPFPVIGRAAFGTRGVHVPSVLRAFVACGWFGVQTWIGGLAIYSIWNAVLGHENETGLVLGKFIAFGVFWFINIYFIWKGTESIRWLEDYSAPILIIIGLILVFWGYKQTGSFSSVLNQSVQLEKPSAELFLEDFKFKLEINALRNIAGSIKASEYQVSIPAEKGTESEYKSLGWIMCQTEKMKMTIPQNVNGLDLDVVKSKSMPLKIQFRKQKEGTQNEYLYSSVQLVYLKEEASASGLFWNYILWFTAMVGFWATMAISISDITRYAKTQNDQLAGQFIGLPGTMMFYSFVGVFVTCAAVVSFQDVLISEDAPWDPVSLVSKFHSPLVVVFAQIAMIIATLTTNIAANVIAPANAFANIFPAKISFRVGGVIAGLTGIALCPWWIMDDISNLLIFVSGLLGPVLGIMLCDYFIIRSKILDVEDLFNPKGKYYYTNGINVPAFVALLTGVLVAILGKWIPVLEVLFSLSWFTGFAVSFLVYYAFAKQNAK